MRHRLSITRAMLMLAATAVVALCVVLWYPRHYRTLVVGDPAQPCEVSVFSPPYGPNARAPDRVTVIWDGRVLFEGTLPIARGKTGMPVDLLKIRCAPGPHTIQVRCGPQSERLDIKVKPGDRRGIQLFGHGEGREVLIEDLGNNPMFA